MALFRIKKDTEEKTSKDAISPAGGIAPGGDVKKLEKVKKVSSTVLSLNYQKDVPAVLRHARVTEKATLLSEKGVYVFDVEPRATKKDVAEAVKALYQVTPRKIHMVRIPSKKTRIRGAQNKFGVKSGGKKAYVFVKKGDTIDIV